MNIVNNFLNFYNDRKELMQIQKSNDEKMEKLNCKDTIVMFLLFERNKTREQIDNAFQHSIWNISSYFNDINEVNRTNLNYVSELLNSNNPNDVCSKLHFICQNKLKNYSDFNQNSTN